jgi:PmbA protein
MSIKQKDADQAMNVDIAKLSQAIIDECSRLEPCQTEVCADDIVETKVVFENTDFSVASSNQSTVFGVRVISNNRLGFITTNSLNENALKEKAREAQMVASLSPENANHTLAPKQKTSGLFEMYDEKLASLSPKEILKFADLLVGESLIDKHVTLDRIELNLTISQRVIQNSNGVMQKVRQAVCGWFVMGMAKDGNEVTSFDYEGNSVASVDEIATGILKTAKEFKESVTSSLGARGCKSYKGQVLLHPAAVSSLIASAISFNVNGRSQQDGMSKWKGLLGTKVASDKLTFIEDPTDESRASDWSPFDREGVLTQKHEIIKDGILNFTAHNIFSAKRGGEIASTGNASGGARSVPGVGLSGIKVATGTASQSDLMKGLGTGLLLKRFSGNADPVSGQFSGVAKNSYWIENGERAYPLKEVMISGNMFDLLNQISLVGSESVRQMGSFDSPYILVDGVSVTSG